MYGPKARYLSKQSQVKFSYERNEILYTFPPPGAAEQQQQQQHGTYICEQYLYFFLTGSLSFVS